MNKIHTVDKKAQQMLDFYGTGKFDTLRSTQRLRFQLISWVIRKKTGNFLKRLFDITVASSVIILASPIMLATAAAIKLESPGSVFFRQARVGKFGKIFYCYKFRSMSQDAEERKEELLDLNEVDDVMFKIKNDPRITRVGSFIRKVSIDELPQLFNVINGDMSLVGPRPNVPNEVNQYKFEQYHRLSVTPGITGLPQVSGRSNLEFKRWIELDFQYIEEQSLLKDIEILLRTIPAVLFGEGAY